MIAGHIRLMTGFPRRYVLGYYRRPTHSVIIPRRPALSQPKYGHDRDSGAMLDDIRVGADTDETGYCAVLTLGR